jgi:(2Fe-2S) ferredoxin
LRRALADVKVNSKATSDTWVLPYHCFDRCGLGPNVVVYPQGIWYEGVEPEDVEAIVKQLAGGPVPELLLADVSQEHAETYYSLFEEVLPELVAEEQKATTPRRRGWWPF